MAADSARSVASHVRTDQGSCLAESTDSVTIPVFPSVMDGEVNNNNGIVVIVLQIVSIRTWWIIF